MKISYSKKNIRLNERQIDYMQKKIDYLKKLAKRIGDESSIATIDVAKTAEKTERIQLKINLKVPNKLFRTQVTANQFEEAVDKAEEKLKVQIEKYKGKFGKNDMHSKTASKDLEIEDASGGFSDLIQE